MASSIGPDGAPPPSELNATMRATNNAAPAKAHRAATCAFVTAGIVAPSARRPAPGTRHPAPDRVSSPHPVSVLVSLLALGFLILVAYRGFSVILFAPVAALG